MNKQTLALLTSETVDIIQSFSNWEMLSSTADFEANIYHRAMTRAVCDFERRDERVWAFNDAMHSYCRNYGI